MPEIEYDVPQPVKQNTYRASQGQGGSSVDFNVEHNKEKQIDSQREQL